MRSRGKILVIRGGAIGDFILTLPALTALRQQFPHSHLEVLGYPHIVQLALAGGLVDRFEAIEARGLAAFFARHGELSEDLRDYFSEFDLIISYLYDPDDIFRTNISRCSPAQFIAGPHRPDEKERIHATQVFLRPLERLAIFDADTVPRLSLTAVEPPADVEAASPLVLAVHPGSGSEAKNWPEASWADFLAQLIQSSNLNLLMVGGEAEGERLERLSGILPPERCEVARSLPLAELAQRLVRCVGFVGHDSGISHLAAALGVPCLVLWAVTNEEVWRPQGERLVILRDPAGIQAITVERVLVELASLLVPETDRA
ncbi:MAG: glycosyltransferase family 9 protein [Verrucomicrobia bacterium]|nr:glycosyltransferase family 9 protein [Verrucomicrobiota bacterium]